MLCCESTTHSSSVSGAYNLHYLWAGKKSIQINVTVFTTFRRITKSGTWLKPKKTKGGRMWKKIEMTTLNLTKDGQVFAMNRCRLVMKETKTRWSVLASYMTGPLRGIACRKHMLNNWTYMLNFFFF